MLLLKGLFTIQTVQRITLNTMTLSIYTERVYTAHGVPISVIGTAQVYFLSMLPIICVKTAHGVTIGVIGTAQVNFLPMHLFSSIIGLVQGR